MNKDPNKLTSKEAADYLGISEHTLRNWRCTKRYNIKAQKIGDKKVIYLKEDLDKFLEECKVKEKIKQQTRNK